MTVMLPGTIGDPADGPPAASETTAADRPGSLLPVLRVIPADCYERSTRRSDWLVVRSVAIYLAAAALLVMANAWWLVLPLWILAGLAVAGLFVLGHDAAHGALYDDAARNRRVGRALMTPSLHIFESWVIGHNRIHHGHTLRQGMDFVWHPVTVDEYRAFGRLAKLRHRLEWSMLGAGAYYMREVWWNKMMRFTAPERYRDRVKSDTRFLRVVAASAVLVVGAIGWVLGDGALSAGWMVVKVLVVPFVVFSWTIGFTVHVHHIADDIAWWPRRSWNSVHGQVEGTTILRIPALANAFLHNIFVHVPHHVDVRIPCYHLPKAADAIRAAFPEVVDRRLRVRDYLRNTKHCKLYDFDEQRWLDYDSVRSA